jgi:hypothetical protein
MPESLPVVIYGVMECIFFLVYTFWTVMYSQEFPPKLSMHPEDLFSYVKT